MQLFLATLLPASDDANRETEFRLLLRSQYCVPNPEIGNERKKEGMAAPVSAASTTFVLASLPPLERVPAIYP